MYRALTTIISLILFSNSSFAKAEKFSGSDCKPRVPNIEYGEAIQIALKVPAVDADSKNVFVDGANLLCEKNKHYWLITLRKRDLETGQMMIRVYMDGTTDTSMKKDG